jgi:hypothetical protein
MNQRTRKIDTALPNVSRLFNTYPGWQIARHAQIISMKLVIVSDFRKAH